MKKIRNIAIIFAVFTTQLASSQVSINSDGSTPNSSSMLDVTSTTKGILVPRMTTAQRTTISSPATGLMVYDFDTKSFWYFDGAWISVPGGNSILSITNGGTGSSSQNFVDLSNVQTVAGAKTWSSLGTFNAGITSNGADINLNNNSNFNTNINTGTSTGVINLGGATSTTNIGSVNNTIGIAGVVNGNGVRIGNGRNTINKPTDPTIGLNSNTTATITQILDAGIIGFDSNSAVTLTLPTAQGVTGLVQALPGTPAVGDVFTFEVFNIGAGNVTLVAGTGGTIVNTNPITSATGPRVVYCRVTSVAANAETISVY